MNDLERELTDLFHQRAAGAEVFDALDDVLDEAPLARTGERSPAARRRSPVLEIAAALVLVAAFSFALLARTAPRTNSPEDDAQLQFPSAVPAAPMASDEATSAALESISILSRDGRVTRLGPTSMSWPPNDRTITDLDVTAPAAVYVGTCCAPGQIIWRNGEAFEPGIRVDYRLDRAVRASVDPATGTVTVGVSSVRASGALDVAVLDPTRALVLVGGSDPALLELNSANFDVIDPRRELVPLPSAEGMCGLSALRGVTLVLVGTTDAAGRCVADRALALAADDHHLVGTLRFPASFVIGNSDHDDRLVGVTGDGRVLLGTLSTSASPSMTWVTLSVPATAVAAAFL